MTPAKLIALNSGRYCLISLDDNWIEGNAIDMLKKELIYYNGDYGDKRPEHIKKVIAEPHEIGWVRDPMEGSVFVAKFEDIGLVIAQVLTFNNWNCFVEDKKIEGKYVIKLPS